MADAAAAAAATTPAGESLRQALDEAKATGRFDALRSALERLHVMIQADVVEARKTVDVGCLCDCVTEIDKDDILCAVLAILVALCDQTHVNNGLVTARSVVQHVDMTRLCGLVDNDRKHVCAEACRLFVALTEAVHGTPHGLVFEELPKRVARVLQSPDDTTLRPGLGTIRFLYDHCDPELFSPTQWRPMGRHTEYHPDYHPRNFHRLLVPLLDSGVWWKQAEAVRVLPYFGQSQLVDLCVGERLVSLILCPETPEELLLVVLNTFTAIHDDKKGAILCWTPPKQHPPMVRTLRTLMESGKESLASSATQMLTVMCCAYHERALPRFIREEGMIPLILRSNDGSKLELLKRMMDVDPPTADLLGDCECWVPRLIEGALQIPRSSLNYNLWHVEQILGAVRLCNVTPESTKRVLSSFCRVVGPEQSSPSFVDQMGRVVLGGMARTCPNVRSWVRDLFQTSPQVRQTESEHVVRFVKSLDDAFEFGIFPDSVEATVARNRVRNRVIRPVVRWRSAVLHHPDKDTTPRHKRVRVMTDFRGAMGHD